MSPEKIRLLKVCAVACAVGALCASRAGAWESQGPGPITGGQVSNIDGGNNYVAGAIQSLLVDPIAGPGGNVTAYAGSVNGGVWMTSNIAAASPVWTPLTDTNASLSVGAMTFDSSDATYQTLVYGVGNFSNNGGTSGALDGLFRSTNGGATWTGLGASTFQGQSISTVAVSGQTFLVGAFTAWNTPTPSTGLYMSGNGGTTFSLVSGGASGLPNAPVTAVQIDPNDSGKYYAAVQGKGVYVSADNGGTSWTQMALPSSIVTIDGGTINPNTDNDNLKLQAVSIGGTTAVYVGVDTGGFATGFFRTSDGGSTWSSLGIPTTVETGITVGLQVEGQGTTNFSFTVDPNNPNVIYAGGDTQPAPNPADQNSYPSPSTPNSSGATNYTSRLFSGTFDPVSGTATWSSITDNNARADQLLVSGSTGTSPHADSRTFALLPNGTLLESDDGGVFTRTDPGLVTGTWNSANGNLAVTEIQNFAYDANSHTLIGGAQDVGSLMQNTTNGTAWSTVSQGDGGNVAVDNITLAASGESIRYSGYVNYQSFIRQVFDSSNNQVGNTESPALAVTAVAGGGTPKHANLVDYSPAFYSPYVLNNIDPKRIAFGGTRFLFESTDKGETLTQLNDTAYSSEVVALAYGGVHLGVQNVNALWAATSTQIYLRDGSTSVAPTLISNIAGLPVDSPLAAGEHFTSLVMSSSDYYTMAVASYLHVWLTTDANDFTDISGNLSSLGAGQLNSLALIYGPQTDALVVGSQSGIFAMLLNNLGVWFSIATLDGSTLPNAFIAQVAYDPGSDTLFASAEGRGVWSAIDASQITEVPETSTTSSLALSAIALLGGVLYRRRVA